MLCKYTINNQIELSLETDLTSSFIDEDLVLALQQAPKSKMEELLEIIKSNLEIVDKLDPARITELRDKNVMYNANIDILRQKFPSIDFPVGVSANILLVNKYGSGGKSIRGRIIHSNGEEVFIVTETQEDLNNLSNYLILKKTAEENSFRFDENSDNYKDLLEIMEIRNRSLKINKLNSILDMILDFQGNGLVYRNIMYADKQKNAYILLSNIRNLILERSGRTTYDNLLVNNIYQLSIYKGNGNTIFRKLDIYNTIKNDQEFQRLFTLLGIDNFNKFKEINKFEINSIENNSDREFVESILTTDPNNSYMYNLLTYIFSKDPTFQYTFKSEGSESFTYYFQPRTIQQKYGIEYNTVYKMDIEDNYRGFKIFKQTDENGIIYYFPSKGYLTEESYSKRFKSIEEAYVYIDKVIDNTIISKSAYLPFKFRKYNDDGTIDQELESYTIYSPQYMIDKQVIESLDIFINPKQEWYNQKEKDLLFFNSTLKDFYNIVQSYNINQELKNRIIKEINTPEKAAIFIYKINELAKNNRSNNDIFTKILDLINNANTKYYYIESKNKENSKYRYKIIPVEDATTLEEYRKNKNYPSEKFMQAVQLHLNKLNVQLVLMTAEEIKQNFSYIDANTSKAFIDNGTIYVNTSIASTSDLIHEYTHLLLGILRSDPNLRKNYEGMLSQLLKIKKAKNLFEHLESIYSERSKVDIMEETFAILFSEYVREGMNSDLSNIFESQVAKTAASKLFSQQISNMRVYFGNSMNSLFKAFSQDIKNLLENSNQLDFDTTKTSRRYSNWISNKLNSENENDKLKEECI